MAGVGAYLVRLLKFQLDQGFQACADNLKTSYER